MQGSPTGQTMEMSWQSTGY